jgi:hypothetical protein
MKVNFDDAFQDFLYRLNVPHHPRARPGEACCYAAMCLGLAP